MEGYEQGRLLVAIPFVCKVLEQSSRSKIFRLPNPWLMAMLRLLVELFRFAELGLNLQFEIEVLLKALKIEIREIEPSSLLKERVKGLQPKTSFSVPMAASNSSLSLNIPSGDSDKKQGGSSGLVSAVGLPSLPFDPQRQQQLQQQQQQQLPQQLSALQNQVF